MKNAFARATVLALLLAFAGSTLAQGNGNGNGRSRLPNGKPFQILANAIKNLDAKLQQQIANLQAQLDANAAADQVRQQMIDSLAVVAQQLEGRLAGLEVRVADVEAYNAVQDARLAFLTAHAAALQAQVAQLQGQLAQQGNDLLTAIVALHNAQQAAINALNQQITILNFVTSVHGQAILGQAQTLSSLNAQLALLNQSYNATRLLLAAGCPAGSSIRALGLSGEMVCQPDTGPHQAVQIAEVVGVPPFGVVSHLTTCPAGFFATGGGAAFPGALGTVGASTPATPFAWLTVVFNPNAGAIAYVQTVNCLRILG